MTIEQSEIDDYWELRDDVLYPFGTDQEEKVSFHEGLLAEFRKKKLKYEELREKLKQIAPEQLSKCKDLLIHGMNHFLQIFQEAERKGMKLSIGQGLIIHFNIYREINRTLWSTLGGYGMTYAPLVYSADPKDQFNHQKIKELLIEIKDDLSSKSFEAFDMFENYVVSNVFARINKLWRADIELMKNNAYFPRD